MDKLGVTAFVAHEDIEPTAEWQSRILDELRHCKAFVALLSRSFRKSNWTDQETGIALAYDKPVIPIKLDVNPYGFIGRYQALKWSDNTIHNIKKLAMLLIEKGVINRAKLIERLCYSGNYDQAGFLSELLLEAGELSVTEINKIAKGSLKNNQVYDSSWATKKLTVLFQLHRDLIKPKTLEKLRKHYFIPES